MIGICKLENHIQSYSWGSKTAIGEVFGSRIVSEQPQAEIWMGAHPSASSIVLCGGKRKSLEELIRSDPAAILGAEVSNRFEEKLPFLFKVLAAEKALSIQAHPSRGQAIEGFSRENLLGLAIDAPHRSYRDDNHKPEIICALTQFWALNGFRQIEEIVHLCQPICSPVFEKICVKLQDDSSSTGMKKCLEWMFGLPDSEVASAVSRLADWLTGADPDDSLNRWLVLLLQDYPGDIGIICAMFLNLVCLSPGEAMYLPAGQLHAYLRGVGIELMANSDNVLRGGLTAKHVDVPELLRVVSFEAAPVRRLQPKPIEPCCAKYETPSNEFCLSVITLKAPEQFRQVERRSIEIMICLEGSANIHNFDDQSDLAVVAGDSVIIPAHVCEYSIVPSHFAKLYVASVPVDSNA